MFDQRPAWPFRPGKSSRIFRTIALRAIIAVLDSFGLGSAPDAARFGDEGANTFGHIVERAGPLDIPNFLSLGLGKAAQGADPRVSLPAPPHITAKQLRHYASALLQGDPQALQVVKSSAREWWEGLMPSRK